MTGRSEANEARYDRMAGSYRLFTRLSSLGTIGRLYRAAAEALEMASFLIRAKAGRVGAEPDAFPLAQLERELEEFRERRLQAGVRSLMTGRKPRVTAGSSPPSCRPDSTHGAPPG